MDGTEDSIETPCDEEKDGSSSLGSSLSSSQDFRRQMKPPNKKQYEDKMEETLRAIRAIEAETKNLGSSETLLAQHHELRAERDATINKRKKHDNDLRTLNQEITKKMGLLSRTESNLHYKNEGKIDDAIRKMECQLKTQNFRLADEKRIVAEIDKLKRSKKVLGEYLIQKKEVDKLRENQKRMRMERETMYRTVTNLNKRDEELRRTIKERKDKSENYKKELDQLYTKKREMFAEFKQSESEYQRHQNERRLRLRKESFKKKEEERKAKEEIWQKELIEYQSQCEPFEDQLNMCNALISYLQKINPGQEGDTMLPSPRDEKPETTGPSFGPADSLDDGKFVLLKKSEESENDYSITNKPRRRSKKGRKISVTKPIAHTPQIISQFSSLTLTPPAYMCEVAASIEQLQARKKYFEEQSGVPLPQHRSLSASFSSSGSFSSSLDSPLRERSTTWGFVPPSIAENQTPSDAGASAESGFHDMSRQASKTESSNSAPDTAPGELVMEDLLSQCMQSGESETSRSSSDTITMEEQLDNGSSLEKSCDTKTNIASNSCSQGNSDYNSDNQSDGANNDSNDSSVFVETCTKVTLQSEEPIRISNINQCKQSFLTSPTVFTSPTYDVDFPVISADNSGKNDHLSDKNTCDEVISRQNVVKSGSTVHLSETVRGDTSISASSIGAGKDINTGVAVHSEPQKPENVAELHNKTQTHSIRDKDSQLNCDITKNIDMSDEEKVTHYDEVTHL